MYKDFSKIYDKLMYDCDYSAYAEFLRGKICKGRAEKPKGIEIGCGSGEMTLRLHALGLEIAGIDLSPEMLSVAVAKARCQKAKVMFLEGDAVDFEYRKNLDFVVSPIDCFSYLEKEDFIRAVANVRAHLGLGGVFCFDLRAEGALLEMAKEKLFFEDTDELSWFWQCQKDGEKIDMNLTFFLKREDGNYEKIEETQTFFPHKKQDVLQILQEAGFGNIQAFEGGNTEFSLGKDRLLFVCEGI